MDSDFVTRLRAGACEVGVGSGARGVSRSGALVESEKVGPAVIFHNKSTSCIHWSWVRFSPRNL